MSTSYGYLVHRVTGESVPIEDCLIMMSASPIPTVVGKKTAVRYDSDPAYRWVEGADDRAPEVMRHPTFRLEMATRAIKSGRHISAIKESFGTWEQLVTTMRDGRS